ncbi:hypothetical protein Tco_1096153 [Tanacetum coccineum]
MLHTCYGHGLAKRTIIQIFYRGLDNPNQGILDTRGIFLYNTPNKAFKILEDKFLLKFNFSDDSQNSLKPKTIVAASGSNINSDHAILMEKFKALATKINSEFLIIKKELKEMRDGRRDNQASQIYLKDDTPMCDPMEANYVQGYHDRKPKNLPKTSTEEMMNEWMARQTEVNERMKNQVVELENRINQGLRNRQAIIENLERQCKYLNEKDRRSESLPHTTNTKPRHEIVYKTPSIQNKNDKGDVELIEEDEIKPIPTMPNLSLIMSNSPTVSPFLKDCTVHIPYMNAKTFADDVLLNHVGDKELKSIDGVETARMTKKEKDEKGMPKELNKEWKMNKKVIPCNKNVFHY